MAHIHNNPGEIDFTVDVFIVHKNTVLIRMHEKYHKWLAVGGHIELNETPDEAALREVKEETGLTVTLYSAHEKNTPEELESKNTTPPIHMNIHPINTNHSHCSMVYYAYSESKDIVEPEDEKSGGCKWVTKEELKNISEVLPRIKFYANEALETLGR